MSKKFVSKTYISKELPHQMSSIIIEDVELHIKLEAASNGYYLTTEVEHAFVTDINFDIETGENIEMFALYAWAEASPIIDEWEKVLTNE